MIKRFVFNNKWNIIAFILYGILTIVLTYPVAFKISTHIAGWEGDTYWHIWDLWWFKYSILYLKSNPVFSDYNNYPAGLNLSFSTLNYLCAFLSIPLQLFLGIVTTYNIMVLSTFALSGFGMYLLVRYLISDKSAAFISGIIFAFCPYHFIHAYHHLNLINTQWIPLYILFLIKTSREGGKWNPVLAGIFLLFNALSSWQYLFFLILFSAIYLLYIQFFNKSLINLSFMRRIGIMTFLFFISIAPFAYPLLWTYYTDGVTDIPSSQSLFSANLISFFTPSRFHTFFGEYTINIYNTFGVLGDIESVTYVGYSVIILSLFSIIKKDSRKFFWLFSSIIFFVLSLGPNLRIFGNSYNMPMPYLILYNYVPFFSLIRAPSRMSILVICSLSVLSGYGIKNILNFLNRNHNKHKIFNQRNFAILLISIIIIIDFLSIPFPMYQRKIPEIYKEIAKDSEDFTVFDIPQEVGGEYLYYQTYHEKRLVYGRASHLIESDMLKRNTFSNKPLIHQLFYPDKIENIDINEKYKKNASSILREYKIKYIVIHKEFLSKKAIDNLIMLLDKVVGNSIHEDKSTIAYRIEKIDE